MFKDENAIVFYISFDPFSLIDKKFQVCCEQGSKENNSVRRLKSMSIYDAISGSGISMKDLYNLTSAPTANIVAVLRFLQKQHIDQIVHFLIDEFNQEILTKSYSTKLFECLKEYFKASSVVISLQSVSKDRKILSSNDKKQFQTETLDIESSGMKIFELEKAVRMSSQLHKLQKNLEHEVERCPYTAPLTFKGKSFFMCRC